jgi:hypothetical protein
MTDTALCQALAHAGIEMVVHEQTDRLRAVRGSDCLSGEAEFVEPPVDPALAGSQEILTIVRFGIKDRDQHRVSFH